MLSKRRKKMLFPSLGVTSIFLSSLIPIPHPSNGLECQSENKAGKRVKQRKVVPTTA